MRPTLPLALLAAALASYAVAQDSDWAATHPDQVRQSQSGDGAAQPEQPAPESTEPPPAPEPEESGPMSLSTARANFPTIVETYILGHLVNEAMQLKDKTGKRWNLRLDRVNPAPLRELQENVFVSCVLMRDGPDKLDVDFTVDFSGPRWRVKAVNIHKVNGKPRFKYKGTERVPVK